MDYILNGVPSGSVANALIQNNFDPHMLRPYIGKDGRSYVDVLRNEGGQFKRVPCPLMNATATLRKDDWKLLDRIAIETALPRLKFVQAIRGAGLEFTIPNGMGKTVLETETISDINDASITMDGVNEQENDRPEFELSSLPLPITHKDFHFTARQIAVSRSGGSPLDTTMAAMAGRKVGESVEKLFLGRLSTYLYAGGTIYGATNYGSRISRTLTAPTAAGWTGSTLLAEVLSMRQDAHSANHFGPYQLFNAPAWDRYLDDDFKANSDKSLRQRISEVDSVSGVTTLDYLQNYDMIMLQMSVDVVRAVVGMEIMTIQWESHGGLRVNFKVMAIIVPQFRADQSSQTGIVHGSTS